MFGCVTDQCLCLLSCLFSVVSLFLSLCLSVCLHIRIYASLLPCLNISSCRHLRPLLCHAVTLFPFCLFSSLLAFSVYPLCLSLAACLSVCISFCLLVCLSVRLFPVAVIDGINPCTCHVFGIQLLSPSVAFCTLFSLPDCRSPHPSSFQLPTPLWV